MKNKGCVFFWGGGGGGGGGEGDGKKWRLDYFSPEEVGQQFAKDHEANYQVAQL